MRNVEWRDNCQNIKKNSVSAMERVKYFILKRDSYLIQLNNNKS